MKPETADYLEKARRTLGEARAVAGIGFAEAAGRAAYLAAFHAAQALIFERSGRVPRTHRGVHAQFSRLAREDPKLGGELPRFLSRAYDFKSVADYEIGPDATVPIGDAISAIESAAGFIDRIFGLFV
ncbi:MAG: HEPN domain-containing protein [Stellaceae bacterium]